MCRCRHEVIDITRIPPPLSTPPPAPPPPGGWPAGLDPDIWVTTPDPVATQPMPPLLANTKFSPLTVTDGKPPKVLPRSYLMWLAVDLDSTLAQGVWTPEEPTSEIGDPIWENVAKVRELAAKGWKIVIHTSRPWHDYEAIEVWANHYEVPVSRIVCGKLLAAAYIDDRAINADDPNWTPRSHDARTA